MNSLSGKRPGVGTFFQDNGFNALLISALFPIVILLLFFYLTFTPKYEFVISGHCLRIYTRCIRRIHFKHVFISNGR